MQKGRTRPDPVSCQSCRSKKLKCNRVQPCSNCAARGIQCHFLVPPPRQTETASTTPHSIPEILGRIERLESIVLQSIPSEAQPKHTSYEIRNSRWMPFAPSSDGTSQSDAQQNREKDSHLLENVGMREDSLLPSLSHGLAFRTSSAREIIEARSSRQYPTPPSDAYSASNNIIVFPLYREAILLLQNYESRVDYMCRILHISHIRSLMKIFYLKVNQGETFPLGQAALLLSLFALSTFFYHPFENPELVASEEEAVRLSTALSKGALDLLDHSRRSTSGTLEDVQAHILMSYVVYHLDGFSARGRILSSTAISIARDLRLHRLDEHPDENVQDVRNLIDCEIKRRVFWHVAAEDWLNSTISGPQEGMYLIHPNHINVRLPKDYLDDDINPHDERDPSSDAQPNGMTFFLARIRLAHLCREIADTMSGAACKLLETPYENIVTLDKKLLDFISSLPFFFKLDDESREKSKPLEAIYPHIPIMRYSIMNAVHSRRCKLHQRFLVRQTYDLRFDYSRQACLESARAIIQGYEGPAEDDSPSYTTARMGMAMHYTYIALVVMVMDLCFHRGDVDEAKIKTEVKAALQKFEDAKDVSRLPRRFLSSLCDILYKHKVYFTEPPAPTDDNTVISANKTRLNAFDLPDDTHMQSTQFELDTHDSTVPDRSFDEFWQFATESEPNLDSLTWDNLFSALDTRPM
ncbi:hypothetical protein F5Y04DRAFT_255851 [Hypomontagnella monticulosa]|nr:hypothetical protein F5Y04DRAFT_255851 [Hypomontagnella monticulosa]